MTKEEFYSEYMRLHQKWPDKYMRDNPVKLKAIYDFVKPLPVSWLHSFINRMLRTEDKTLDIMKAAVGELKALNDKKRTEVIVNKPVEMSDDGLSKTLESIGANSILDAIQSGKFKSIT